MIFRELIKNPQRRSQLISIPTNFSHVVHMGPGEGLEIIKDLPTVSRQCRILEFLDFSWLVKQALALYVLDARHAFCMEVFFVVQCVHV